MGSQICLRAVCSLLMAAPQSTVWDIEPHTIAKHEILKHYLDAWYPILVSREEHIMFLDGFAGPGVYSDGSPGSPIVALLALLHHRGFGLWSGRRFDFDFVEADSDRLEHLENEIATRYGPFPDNISVRMHLGEFQHVAGGIASRLRSTRGQVPPTLAFVDPFGVSGVPMRLIADFLSAPKCELVMTLMVSHLNRFGEADQMQAKRAELFGTNDFALVDAAPAEGRVAALLDLYQAQLQKVAGFKHTLDFQMRNNTGNISYYLVYATRSATGVEKFKDAMWKVDPSRGCAFSDRRFGQSSLFTGEHVDHGPLCTQIGQDWEGRTATIAELDEYVNIQTLYRKAHLRGALAQMERAGRLVVHRPRGGRRGFPSGTQVQFNAGLGI